MTSLANVIIIIIMNLPCDAVLIIIITHEAMHQKFCSVIYLITLSTILISTYQS